MEYAELDAKEIGKALAELRGDKTPKEVADALGISISALYMYERGERIPRDTVKIRIANYYKRPIHKIFFAKKQHNM